MSKQEWKAGNMLYPLPAVLVTCRGKDGKDNIITVAWTGTICTNPAMVYISVRPERNSYEMIKEKGEFVINLSTKDMAKIVDYCGVKSGKDVDKFKNMNLTKGKANKVDVCTIEESPVNIECKVDKILKLGSHHMFIAKVLCVDIEEDLLDKSGKFNLNKSDLLVYSHGEYFDLGKNLGTFGYSVRKKKSKKGKTNKYAMKKKKKK